MINLFPPAHKKEIKKEYMRRFIVVFGLFFVAGAIVEMVFCSVIFYRIDAYFKETEKVLELTKWVIGGPKGAAELLNIHPNTLRSRLPKLGIQKPE